MNTERILVVEDESEIRDLIVLHLKRDGHTALDAVGSVEEAFPLLDAHQYSLVVLDWMLPGMSGVEMARRLRAKADRDNLAILMVTARAEAGDIVAGLEAGADDYLSKPFEPAVLIARVRALLRRHRRPTASAVAGAGATSGDAIIESFTIGDLSIDSATYEVKCAGEQVALTPSEFKLLQTLAQNRGRVLTRESLIQHVQGEGVSVVGRTVDTHVFGLRKKLGSCADVIETVRGIGYRVKAP